MIKTATRLLPVMALLALVLAVGSPASAFENNPGDGEALTKNHFGARYVSTYNSATTLEELQFAPDFTAEHANVLRLYQAFFNRVPDLEGARYWLQQWDAVAAQGVTAQRPEGHDRLGEFAGYFAQSDEFRNVYGDADNNEFLSRVYDNMLGRDPDPDGFNYWLGYLEGTNPEQPGVVLSKGSTMRWVTRNDEFIVRYPFGHEDRSPHPSDNADCSIDNVAAFEVNLTGIYRLRDGDIRELCFGDRDVDVEEAWTRLAELAEPTHLPPVALLGVYEGNATGTGIVAYAGPARGEDGNYVGDLWLISASDTASRLNPVEADLTMSHELSHVFTQVDSQIDYDSFERNGCDGRLEAFFWCFQEDSYLNEWVNGWEGPGGPQPGFWSEADLNVWRNNSTGAPNTQLCTDGHQFPGVYATTSPYEDMAEAFSAYVHGVNLPNMANKYAFFDSKPLLKGYRDRAIASGRYNYPDSFGGCSAG